MALVLTRDRLLANSLHFMPKFTVIYTKGRASIKGSNVFFDESPGRSMLDVDAATRASAFIKAYQHLTSLGLEVFVPKAPENGHNPLGFSDAEIEAVNETGVQFTSDIRNGARIEKIIEAL